MIGELSALVAEQPLRENLSAHLMLALYRSGRQAESLDAYRRTREALVAQFGIEPTPSLRALERAILTQDSSLDLDAAPHEDPAAPYSSSLRTRTGWTLSLQSQSHLPGCRRES